MAFDPTKPVEGTEIDAAELRNQFNALKALYDAVSDAKDEFAFVDFGFNPDVVIPPGSSMDAWMVSGMVTVGIGNNIWAGGENKSRFSLSLHQLSGTVKLDGKILIDKGKLKLLEEKK